jgi:hypothetical protein
MTAALWATQYVLAVDALLLAAAVAVSVLATMRH